jgi:hypothetical protein
MLRVKCIFKVVQPHLDDGLARAPLRLALGARRRGLLGSAVAQPACSGVQVDPFESKL